MTRSMIVTTLFSGTLLCACSGDLLPGIIIPDVAFPDSLGAAPDQTGFEADTSVPPVPDAGVSETSAEDILGDAAESLDETRGQNCGAGDECAEGLHCLPETGECVECRDFEDCQLSSPCTFDYCDDDHACMHKPVEGECDDQDPCSLGDHCDQGECVGETYLECGDGNDCTIDLCTGQGCAYDFSTGECDDQDPCTVGDLCVDGTCTPGGEPLDCDDGNQCTFDFCVQFEGCHSDPNDAACDDGDPCTAGEHCHEGACAGEPVDCADGNACTEDYCEPDTGCVHPALEGSPCDDGNACTSGDACTSGGACTGEETVCDDSNSCTFDSCSPEAGGCTYMHLEAGPCNDNDGCTENDACVGGECVGSPLDCNDQNPCTGDSCVSPFGSCENLPLDVDCDDGNACTMGDKCFDGNCLSGPEAPDCNDGNECTADSCSPLQGCVNAALAGVPCDDVDNCTVSDQCSPAGQCHGQTVDCADNDQCTADVCDPGTGNCLNEPDVGAGCNDGDKCTKNDKCKADGSCQGAPKACNDGNSCTTDSCVPATGCVNTPQTGPQCNDGDPCSSGDHCQNGVCTGDFMDCDDGDPCTTDTCGGGGCINQKNIPGTMCGSCYDHCNYVADAVCHCDKQCGWYKDCCDDTCDYCDYNFCD